MRRLVAPSLLALAASLTAAAAAPVTFSADGANFQTFTAPSAGIYDILATGAAGGAGFTPGGLGAEIGGDFTLAAGATLSIAVGVKGGSAGGGGGGGSFVIARGRVPLLIAGGGGGGGSVNAGGAGLAGPTSIGEGSGTVGSGGLDAGGGGGGGGGGFNSDSIPSGNGGDGNGGLGYPSLLGGSGFGVTNNGGFGGGGGGGTVGGGGGGGYSGGGGGTGNSSANAHGGYGGGSFDVGVNQVLVAGFNSGDGSVAITELSAVPVPEPASLALLGMGLAGLLAARRRRAG